MPYNTKLAKEKVESAISFDFKNESLENIYNELSVYINDSNISSWEQLKNFYNMKTEKNIQDDDELQEEILKNAGKNLSPLENSRDINTYYFWSVKGKGLTDVLNNAKKFYRYEKAKKITLETENNYDIALLKGKIPHGGKHNLQNYVKALNKMFKAKAISFEVYQQKIIEGYRIDLDSRYNGDEYKEYQEKLKEYNGKKEDKLNFISNHKRMIRDETMELRDLKNALKIINNVNNLLLNKEEVSKLISEIKELEAKLEYKPKTDEEKLTYRKVLNIFKQKKEDLRIKNSTLIKRENAIDNQLISKKENITALYNAVVSLDVQFEYEKLSIENEEDLKHFFEMIRNESDIDFSKVSKIINELKLKFLERKKKIEKNICVYKHKLEEKKLEKFSKPLSPLGSDPFGREITRYQAIFLGIALNCTIEEIEKNFLQKMLQQKGFNLKNPLDHICFWALSQKADVYQNWKKAVELFENKKICLMNTLENSDNTYLMMKNIDKNKIILDTVDESIEFIISQMYISDEVINENGWNETVLGRKIIDYNLKHLRNSNLFPLSKDSVSVKTEMSDLISRFNCYLDLSNEQTEKMRISSEERKKLPEMISRYKNDDLEEFDYDELNEIRVRLFKDIFEERDMFKLNSRGIFNERILTVEYIKDLSNCKRGVNRQDVLLTVFATFSTNPENFNKTPKDKLKDFEQFSNKCLENCGMYELYYPDPFEAFLAICVCQKYPFEFYRTIIESNKENYLR